MKSGYPNRSWLLRGRMNPAPWASSVPSIFENEYVIFTRRTPHDDGYGNVSGRAEETTVWSTKANVQDITSPDKNPDPSGPDGRAQYCIITKKVRISSDMPSKDDLVTWTDTFGEEHRCYVLDVSDPAEEADHLEIIVEDQG